MNITIETKLEAGDKPLIEMNNDDTGQLFSTFLDECIDNHPAFIAEKERLVRTSWNTGKALNDAKIRILLAVIQPARSRTRIMCSRSIHNKIDFTKLKWDYRVKKNQFGMWSVSIRWNGFNLDSDPGKMRVMAENPLAVNSKEKAHSLGFNTIMHLMGMTPS